MAGVEAELRSAEALLARRDLAKARDAFDHAQRAGADLDACGAGRWMASMLAGDFAAAWREGDVIRTRGTPDRHRFWKGEDLRQKRVIVRCLHGFGDTVQMLAYAPALQKLAAKVVWEVPPRLLPVASFFEGVTDVVSWGDHAPARLPEWDVQVEVTELPYVFRTELADLPVAMGYLRLPRPELAAAALAMGARTKPKVGVVWACGDWNPSRNVPLPLLEPLLRRPELEWWNLQGAAQAQEANGLPLRPALEICGDGLLTMAATIANLDLVLTPDTLAVHLAGAMGVPAWLMLQHEGDWRWMTERGDSPWYPSLRLFRQPAQGDWAAVLAEVEALLPRVFPMLR